MKFINTILIVAAVTTLLSGCAKTSDGLMGFEKDGFRKAAENWDKLRKVDGSLPNAAIKRLSKKKVKKNSLSAFEYRELKEGHFGTKNHQMDMSADAYDFESGKSYYKAFKLPDFIKPYQIKVQSYLKASDTIFEQALFYPAFLLLDGSYQPIALVDSKVKQEEVYDNLELNGGIVIEDSAPKYLIVLTTDEVLKGTTEMLTRKVLKVRMVGPYAAFTSKVEYVRVNRHHSPEGSFRVFVENELQSKSLFRFQ